MELSYLVKLSEEEDKQFTKYIRDMRKEHIKTVYDNTNFVFKKYKDKIAKSLQNKDISNILYFLRETCYEEFLLEESKFNTLVLKELINKFSTPKDTFKTLLDNNLNLLGTKEEIYKSINDVYGEYSGMIYPYIYHLGLSNTQSRRSRAGKTFEYCIYALYNALDYKYASQALIGSSIFEEKGFGKLVDSLLPGLEEFEKRRDKVIVGTMKTTLRERWQEVVEELKRANLSSIYLLTADDNISKSVVDKMAKHNLILVVFQNFKEKLLDKRNVISFEEYFFHEIPDILNYWEN